MITLSVATAIKGSVQKRILATPDGPTKDGTHNLGISQGDVRTVALDDLGAFADLLNALSSNDALILGTACPGAHRFVAAKHLERENAAGAKNGTAPAIARTLDYFGWPEDGYHLLLLDHDPEPGRPDLTADDFWGEVVDLFPELASAGRVVTVSTSSAIYDKATGECLKPSSGHHTYIAVRGDVVRFVDILKTRAWASGKAFFKLSSPNIQTGTESILERFLTDVATFSPERLVYEAGAILPSCYEQRRPPAVVNDGDWIDLDAIPEPTPEEIALAEANRKAAREAIAATRLTKTVERVKKAQPSLGEKEAVKVAKARLKAVDGGVLAPDHVLHLANGGTLRAGDIGPQHHRVKCKDPQEPDYRGGELCGMIFCEAPGQWAIKSFAHGGKRYQGESTRRLNGKANDEPPPELQAVAQSLGLPAHGSIADISHRVMAYYAPGQVAHDLTIINGPNGISPSDQAMLLKAGRPVLVDGRTGCGKTEMVARIRPRIEGKKLGTAATITLAGGMAERFGATPVSSQHEPATKNTWTDAVTPAESLYRSMGNDYALWAIDEAGAIFPRWLMGTLGSTGQTRNQKRARWLGRTVPHQFFLQAHPSPITLDAIEHFTGKRPLVVNLVREPQLESSVTVHVLEDGTDRTGATLSGIATAVDMARDLAKQGKRSLFVGGSKDVLKGLQREFRKNRIQVTLRDGTYTLAPVAVGFGANPTQHCDLALITLLSRNAETGVDLQNDFDAVFALPSVQQSASEAWQHISRARSLFDGRTKDLYIHFPKDPTRFMAWEHLTPQYHLEKIKARNAYYMSLIGQGNPELRGEIADLEAGFTLAARYMAEHCAGRWFQREYLLGQFADRGWTVDTIAPAPSALGFLDSLAQHRDTAVDAEAFAIAKGRRILLEYSEKRATEIDDSNQSGFVLGCYRTKLALAAHFPASPLEDRHWIRANILDRPAKKAQARLLGLFTLDNAQAAVDDYSSFLQREAIKHGDDHGALSMLRKLESSDTLPILRLYQALAPHRGIIQATLVNMATLSASHPDALALADVLRKNADTLNQFAAKCLDDSNGFDWTEAEPMALVSKFLGKYMGIPFGRAGQRRTADGTENQYQVGYCPGAIYRMANNAKAKLETWQAKLDAQHALLAKRQKSKRVKPETIAKIHARIADLTATVATRMAEYQAELDNANAQRDEVATFVRPHIEMALSAAQGWIERLNFAPITKHSPVTLNSGYQSLIREFSVTPPENAQADPPPDNQPPANVDRDTWRELREWFATAVMDGGDALSALRDTVITGLGAHVWQALGGAA